MANKYVDSLQGADIYEKAAHGLVRELNDPYSELLAPKQNDEFNRAVGGRYGGIGMLLEEQKTPTSTTVVVSRVFPNTPAEEGGVREGDRIIPVDYVSTADAKIDKVSDALRGVAGTKVTRDVRAPGRHRADQAAVHARGHPRAGRAVHHDARRHIGYIPLQTFNENTAEEVETAAKKLVAEGAKGIVLDMRDNGGGIVDQSLETSSSSSSSRARRSSTCGRATRRTKWRVPRTSS